MVKWEMKTGTAECNCGAIKPGTGIVNLPVVCTCKKKFQWTGRTEPANPVCPTCVGNTHVW